MIRRITPEADGMTDTFALSEHPEFPAGEYEKKKNIEDEATLNFFTFHGR